MGLAYRKQNFQDWLTQQWVISFGRKISLDDVPWLIGPFGNLLGIGEVFINELAQKEELIIEREKSRGVIPDMNILNLSENEYSNLSDKVVAFYENTSNYSLDFTVKWNPFFKWLGIILNKLFTSRINQLNIPISNLDLPVDTNSEIINLIDPNTNQIKYTIWLRTRKSSGEVIYSGIYGICKLPSGKTCVKAVFPLPKGNATVILTPGVDERGSLILDSSGKKFGDAGFYFLLSDSKGNYWSKFISSFRDKLVVNEEGEHITAEQTLTLWHQRVVRFNYRIRLIG